MSYNEGDVVKSSDGTYGKVVEDIGGPDILVRYRGLDEYWARDIIVP